MIRLAGSNGGVFGRGIEESSRDWLGKEAVFGLSETRRGCGGLIKVAITVMAPWTAMMCWARRGVGSWQLRRMHPMGWPCCKQSRVDGGHGFCSERWQIGTGTPAGCQGALVNQQGGLREEENLDARGRFDACTATALANRGCAWPASPLQ